MTLLTAAVLDSMRSTGTPDRWPAIVAQESGVRGSVEDFVAAQVDDVRNALIERLGAGDLHGPSWARAAIWGMGLAAREGARAEAMPAPGLLHMVGADGEAFMLAPLAFSVGAESGSDQDIDRLVDVLEGALEGHRYTLHLKKPIPGGFDPAPIAQAVHLWLAAMRRGSEVGYCAAYDDDDVSIEICLTELARKAGQRGLILLVEPKRSLERLAQVDSRLMHAVTESDEVAKDVPLVALLAADGPWALPRGYVNQVLYGTPREVSTAVNGSKLQYDALYRSNGLSLFSDPLCRRLGSVWWAEPTSEDGLAARSWSHENPWSDGGVPLLRGRRFWRREGPTGAHRTVVMNQSKEPPLEWRPLP